MIAVQLPVASDMHFFVKLVCAAPCRFCAAARSLQHFLVKLVNAAPCRFFDVACALQLSSAAAAVTIQNEARTSAIVFILPSMLLTIDNQKFAAGSAVYDGFNVPFGEALSTISGRNFAIIASV